MMTPEQRYWFDLTGYLHIQNALNPDELAAAQEAAARYINTPNYALPPGFEKDGRLCKFGFAFDKALERLVFHPAAWPVILELTNGKPMLANGTLQFDDPKIHTEALHFHCAREDFGWESTRYETRDGHIFCDDFVCFPYLDDVHPGDGGLLVVPGSHKSNFQRPPELFNNGTVEHLENLPPGVINITPKAGDFVIMPELMTHGTLTWQPKNRQRRSLVLRYRPQYKGQRFLPDAIIERLSPETQELTETAHYTHTKEVAKQATVELTV
jgi:ectoine hydroxylase-related dioxygenase (phytanoyl-CoA dioxygenase family)